MKTIDIHLRELFFPLPTDRFANMTRSRVWQKSLFSSNSNSGCDNVFGDDPKPMHQSCWLVDKKAFSVLHVSHFEILVLFSTPLLSVEMWFMFCLIEGIALCVDIPELDVLKWVYNIFYQENVIASFKIFKFPLHPYYIYVIIYLRTNLIQYRMA